MCFISMYRQINGKNNFNFEAYTLKDFESLSYFSTPCPVRDKILVATN